MNDLDTLLRAADPAAETPDFTDAERRAILTAALTPQQPSRRRLGWRIGAVAAATLTAIGLGIGNLGGSSAEARADEALSQAAINAVDPVAQPGQYWKIVTTADSVDLVTSGEDIDEDGAVSAEEQQELRCPRTVSRTEYVAVDGSRPSWFAQSRKDKPEAPAACQGLLGGPGDPEVWTTNLAPNDYVEESWQMPSTAFLAALPRDFGSLRERLYADSDGRGTSPDSSAFVYAADALRSGLVPADLRSALFEVMRSIPGVVVAQDSNVDGGIVVIEHRDDRQQSLLVDPDGGQVVGESSGEDWTARITRELVDEVPADVRDSAVRQECEVLASGAVECS